MKIINTNIGADYVPSWSWQEALREIYQNFEDYGDFECQVNDTPASADLPKDYVDITLSSDAVLDLNILRLGFTNKTAADGGGHAEGLKLACLVLSRNNIIAEINIDTYTFYPRIEDSLIGRCLVFEVKSKTQKQKSKAHEIKFSVPKAEYDKFLALRAPAVTLAPLHKTLYGDIVDAAPGTIYVDSRYVCQLPDWRYAYNFKPSYVQLDRDRRIPSDFDVKWTAAGILKSYPKLDKKAIYSPDVSCLTELKPETVKRLNPKPYKVGTTVKYRIGNKPVPDHLTKALRKDPLIQKRTTRLLINFSKKRTPHTLLKEFWEEHKNLLTAETTIDFKVLLRKSKDWKNK